MRFYDIKIRKNGELIRSPSLSGSATKSRTGTLFGLSVGGVLSPPGLGTSQQSTYTSYVNGQTLPGALQIELQIPVAPRHTPYNGSVTIWGVSKEEISQSYDLIGAEIEVWGGMRKGLELAKPGQSQTPLCNGRILQSFGNWIGAEQNLTFVIQPDGVGRAGDSKNFSFLCKPNASLADAIKATMATAMPNAKVAIHISDELKFDYELNSVHGTLAEFSSMLVQLTLRPVFQGIKPVNGMQYGGIQCLLVGDQYVFTDGTKWLKSGKEVGSADAAAHKIDFSDVIGQPTWQGINQISFKTVMRSDISVGDTVRLPEAVAPISILNKASAPTTLPGSKPYPSRDKSTFKGNFQIIKIDHYGNFRQPSGDAWVTQFVAIFPAQKQAEEKIPDGRVIVGQPTLAGPTKSGPRKVAEQQSTVVNPTPPNVIQSPTPGLPNTTPSIRAAPFNLTPSLPPFSPQAGPVTGAAVPSLGFVVRR